MKDEETRKAAVALLGEEGFEEANRAAAAALGALLAACGGHTVESCTNAAGILFVALVRASDGSCEDATTFVAHAYDAETTERIAACLTSAAPFSGDPTTPVGQA